MKRTFYLAGALVTIIAIMVLAANAQDTSTSSKPWLYQHAKKTEEVKSLKSGDEIAWVCPMCKTVKVTRIGKEKPVAEITQSGDGVVFTCPDCGAAGFCSIRKKEGKSD